MKVVSHTHRSDQPNWFFWKYRLEIDLAQKLAADAISAAVAQMKSETSSNEELPRKEEKTPVVGNSFFFNFFLVFMFYELEGDSIDR